MPIYIIIQGDAAGNIKANGKMSSGKGAVSSHYQGYLKEKKDIDLGNLFLREIVPFMGPLANVVVAPVTSKTVETPAANLVIRIKKICNVFS